MNESRRQFNGTLLGSLLTYSLLETIFADDLLADEVRPLAAAWLADLDQLGRDLRGAPLEQTTWQDKVEELHSQVDLADLLTFLDFDKLTHNLQYRERGERSLRPQLPEVEGLPRELVFGQQIFALQKDRAVVPHGHYNLASSFLVLKGEFHGRHYDRLEDDRTSMIIRPTIDRQFGPGEYSTISEHRDNVHWFQATSETAFIYNMHVVNLQPDYGRPGGRVYIDPHGEKLSGGRIRAEKLRAAEALRRYG
ncbi:MAG: hypothetical protein DWQ42_07545 [Planctomycetota bacterium]|nr:MAG: hypothetical protein DWQ42_07545 [Planctomycetota bacterium]REK37853.1 MAG: hypothetical protein DWQ46_21565 [Planctomycetota bacterium]